MAGNVELVARNKKAHHDYHIEETIEAGLVLKGTEVKSLRNHRVSIKDSFAQVENGEIYLYNMHIAPYKEGNINNHEPERRRKLLLRKSQIRSLIGMTTRKGYTLIPLTVYFRNNWAKIELAVAKGKAQHDKRREIARRDAQREIERAFKERQQM